MIKVFFRRIIGTSPVMFVVLGYAALLLVVFLGDLLFPLPLWTIVASAMTGLGFLCFVLGLVLGLCHLLQWRRVAESFFALLLLVPIGFAVHTSVVRALSVGSAQQAVAAEPSGL